MAIDLATAYVRSGITQKTPENNALLTEVLNISLAALENYLDRKFIFDGQAESFYYTHFQDYPLDRYPVENVSAIYADGRPLNVRYKVHRTTGILKLDHHVFERELRIVYTGGYRVVPADLEAALWATFQEFLVMVQGQYATTTGEIDSVTVQDVGTVRFSNNSSFGTGGSLSNPNSGPIPESAAFLCRPYRRFSA